jgi:PhnB protein
MADVDPIPDSYPRVTPYLYVDGAEAAIDFYVRVFGAVERMRMNAPDGRVAHAELAIGDGLIMVSDEFPDYGALAPGSIGGSPVTMAVYVEDVDAVCDAAIAAGATAKVPVKDEFYGDRVGMFIDPFGHGWHVATHIEDVSPEDMRARMEAQLAE